MIRIRVPANLRFTRAERALAALYDRLAPGRLRSLMQGPIRTALNDLIRDQFATEGAAWGQRWPALAASTRAKKLAAGVLSRGILVFSGAMRRGMLRFRPQDARLQATTRGVRADFDVGVHPYRFHHLGTRFMPKRQAIPDPLPRSFRREIRSIVRDYLLTGAGVEGLGAAGSAGLENG
jgi:hypothetical protein